MKNMRKTKIAQAKPFEGAPQINMPSILGASANKPILFRVAVTGKRPISYGASNLPKGLSLKDNVLSGTVEENGSYEFTLTAENDLGRCEKRVTLEIADQNVLVTPLLGYTTWNAFATTVTQGDVENIASKLVQLGITEYGYGYVNTDSGWQGTYGGKYDAIMPNSKFPDMKKMTDKIHSYGLKCGIYSTPMLTAWGCPADMASIPGCTQGEPDYRFGETNGGIGIIHKEANNAKQWNEWGFDYLKYDWTPTDPVNADLMRLELIKQERDFGFCVTVRALKEYSNYWSKYCNSYRCNTDTFCNFENLCEVYESYFDFQEFVCKGHYFDLDMLDFGTCKYEALSNALTEDEIILEYSMRAFLGSPLQISSTLEDVSDFELSVYCNEEIIAIHQDCAFNTPTTLARIKGEGRKLDIFEKKLEDGTFAYAFFNLGEKDESVKLTADEDCVIRDAWAKEEIPFTGAIEIPLHTAKIIKCSKQITIGTK